MPRPTPFTKTLGAALLAVATALATAPAFDAVAAEVRDADATAASGDPPAGTPVVGAGSQVDPAPDPRRAGVQPSASTLSERVAERPTRTIVGQASWYGPGFEGRSTASGEAYDPSDMVAAHRSLPFGTRVRVTNRNNGLSTVVRIIDRGPYVGGRVLDLSAAAADAIGMRGSGTAPVSIEIL